MTIQNDSQKAGLLEPQFLEERLRASGIATTITRALIRCMDANEMRSYLQHWYFADSGLRNELLRALANTVEDQPDQLAVACEVLAWFMTSDEANFTASNRAALDATIRRLVALLPAAEQVMLAPQFLLHKRAARRRIGAYIVGSHPEHCLPDMKQTLLEAYEQWHDPQVLAPLSRISSDVSDVAPMLLGALTKLSGPGRDSRCLNEQARVFAHLVRADLPQAMALAEQYSTAFVFGVGKARQKNALRFVLDILTKARQQYSRATQAQAMFLNRSRRSPTDWSVAFASEREAAERIRLCIWTLGRLQARDALEALARDYDIQRLEAIHADDHNVDEA